MRIDSRSDRSVPKLVGADFELGNFILGLDRQGGTGPEASVALLAEVDGVRASSGTYGYAYGWGGAYGGAYVDPQDRGRKFLPCNGGCIYIDLDHLECCVPEMLSAFDHAAATAAMLRLARRAQVQANEKLPPDQSIQVLVHNSDGRSNSFGSHLNFLTSTATWDDIVHRRPHYLQFLASHQLSSIVYTGQGKVGAENERPAVAYQLSQRADFFETVVGPQTTHRRPIVNSRDESLCGESQDLARLHVIFFDNTLCSGANVLKVGSMQLVLAMLEAEDIDIGCTVDDPVGAAVAWSHDPSLRRAVRMTDGRSATAIEVQQRLLEHAFAHRELYGFETVPRADEILALWADTLAKLAGGDFDALLGRIDWVLKQRILETVLDQREALSWDSPEVRYLDQIFGSLDPDEGLFLRQQRAGLVEEWVSEAEIEHFVNEPPEDTRAWTRAMVLRHFDAEDIEAVDWDEIRLRFETRSGRRPFRFHLDDPLGFTREISEPLFERLTQQGEPHANP